MKSDKKNKNTLEEKATSQLCEPMSIKLCRQSFPIMLPSCFFAEQLRATAQSDTAASPSREFFGTGQHMTSEQVGCNSDTYLTGMHLTVITGSAQILLISNKASSVS